MNTQANKNIIQAIEESSAKGKIVFVQLTSNENMPQLLTAEDLIEHSLRPNINMNQLITVSQFVEKIIARASEEDQDTIRKSDILKNVLTVLDDFTARITKLLDQFNSLTLKYCGLGSHLAKEFLNLFNTEGQQHKISLTSNPNIISQLVSYLSEDLYPLNDCSSFLKDFLAPVSRRFEESVNYWLNLQQKKADVGQKLNAPISVVPHDPKLLDAVDGPFSWYSKCISQHPFNLNKYLIMNRAGLIKCVTIDSTSRTMNVDFTKILEDGGLDSPSTIDYSPSGDSFLVNRLKSDKIYILKGGNGHILQEIQGYNSVTHVRWISEARIVVGDTTGEIKVFDRMDLQSQKKPKIAIPLEINYTIYYLLSSVADNTFYVGNLNGDIVCMDAMTLKNNWFYEQVHYGYISCIKKKNNLLFSGGGDNKIKILDENNLEIIFSSDIFKNRVIDLSISLNEKEAIITTEEELICLNFVSKTVTYNMDKNQIGEGNLCSTMVCWQNSYIITGTNCGKIYMLKIQSS